MNTEKIFEIIHKCKTEVFHANEIDLPEFSGTDVLELFRLAVEEDKKDDNCIIQALPRVTEKKLDSILPELILGLNETNMFSELNKFPVSFRITNIQLYQPKILKLNQKLYENYSQVIRANLYFTPNPQHNALSLHTDQAFIFVHQISGDKAWTILENYENGEYDKIRFNTLDLSRISKKTELVLKKNQVLYLPFKVPHKAVATANGHSIHITYAFKYMLLKNKVVNFVMQKMWEDLKIPKNKYNIAIGQEKALIDDFVYYFRKLEANDLKKELLENLSCEKRQFLEQGQEYGR